MSKKRVNSCAKGKRGEREVAALLRANGFPFARRGQQFKGTADSPDVVCDELPNVYMEVKTSPALRHGTKALREARKGAARTAGVSLAPVLFRKVPGGAWVMDHLDAVYGWLACDGPMMFRILQDLNERYAMPVPGSTTVGKE